MSGDGSVEECASQRPAVAAWTPPTLARLLIHLVAQIACESNEALSSKPPIARRCDSTEASEETRR
jgi:hypothetical protein